MFGVTPDRRQRSVLGSVRPGARAICLTLNAQHCWRNANIGAESADTEGQKLVLLSPYNPIEKRQKHLH